MKKKIIISILILVLSISLFTGCDLSGFLPSGPSDPEGDDTTLSSAVSALGDMDIELKSVENTTIYENNAELVDSIKNSVVEIEVAKTTSYEAPSTNGSGVLFAKSDSFYYVVTNHHVIDGWEMLWVKVYDATTYPASLKGSDEDTDIGVLMISTKGIDGEKYKTVTIPSDEYKVRVGDTAIVIGTPLGILGGSVTMGIVSSLERQVSLDGITMTLMQTDAAINGGNSGGGMFDAYGQLIGVVNAKSQGTGIEGIGFAIPIKTAVKTACDIIEHGRVLGKPGLGIDVLHFESESEIDEFLTQFYFNSDRVTWENYFNYTNKSAGLYVYSVENPYCELIEGDYIVSVEDVLITKQEDLRAILDESNVGDVLSVVVKRAGVDTTIDVTLIEIKA